MTTPFLVPLAWLRNRRTDPARWSQPATATCREGVRSILKAVGLGQFAIAVVLIASPSTMVDIWPWRLAPLAAATLGAWFALPGVTALMMGIDGRWSAIRITLESQLIGLALILLATARAWEQFDKSNALTYVFAGGMALLLVGLAALWSRRPSRRRSATRRRLGDRVAVGADVDDRDDQRQARGAEEGTRLAVRRRAELAQPEQRRRRRARRAAARGTSPPAARPSAVRKLSRSNVIPVTTK